ncbi:hypothetical protein Skr01_43270 [Sphaerisporangium krabiense]|nr:hypothetical protein Skr01_43270 [Sphaerisporangium krabiense]
MVGEAEALAHVTRRCREGRFPWARAYAARLRADHPRDPFPLLLEALIHAYQGDADACRASLALADELGPGSHPGLRATIDDVADRSGRGLSPEAGQVRRSCGSRTAPGVCWYCSPWWGWGWRSAPGSA